METFKPPQVWAQAEKEVVQSGMEALQPVYVYRKDLPLPPSHAPYAYNPLGHNAPLYEVPRKPEQRIWGFTRRAFFTLFFIVLLILVGAAVGGSVGGYFAGKSNSTSNVRSSNISASDTSPFGSTSSSPSSSTKTSPVTVTPTPYAQFPSSGLLANPCPAADQVIYNQNITASMYSFRINCGINYLATANAISGSNTSTIEECLHYCAWTNNRLSSCIGVVWQTNLTEAEKPNQLANCWLVNSTPDSVAGSLSGTVVSANLASKIVVS